VTDPENFRPYRTSLALLAAIFGRWPEHAAWRSPPYEYEYDKMPIDILSGSNHLRTLLSIVRTITVCSWVLWCNSIWAVVHRT